MQLLSSFPVKQIYSRIIVLNFRKKLSNIWAQTYLSLCVPTALEEKQIRKLSSVAPAKL